jgi:hypothetical protein
MAPAGTEARPTDVFILVPKLHLGTQLWPKLGLGKLISNGASRLKYGFHQQSEALQSIGFPSAAWEPE